MPIPPEFQKIIDVARREAYNRKTAAGYNGAHHDGGASTIEAAVENWIAGLNGHVPPSLKDFEKLARQESDSDWSEYQRLRKKFG